MTRKKIYETDNPRYEAVKAYREARKIVRVPLDMPSDEAEALRSYCSDHGLTVAGFIRGLVRDAIAGDTGSASPRGDIGSGRAARVDPENSREEEKTLDYP